jgi:predicted transcriptional regulator
MRKIDFTCKKVTLKDLVQCNYNLNESEYLIFAEIIKSKKGLSVKELVEKIEKDRTTVQKILTKLLKRQLLVKRQINLDRGFMFVYFSKNKDEIVDEIELNVESYFAKIKESLAKWKKN